MEEYKQRLKRQNVLLWIGIVLLVVLDVLVGIFWGQPWLFGYPLDD